MYDYNFEERLSERRLTFLLLSLVIPVETQILQNIYKKKKEQERTELHKEIRERQLWKNSCVSISDGFENVILQIKALYPGFIMCSMDYVYRDDDVIHTYPLKEWKDPRWEHCGPIPSGISVINHVFEDFKERNRPLYHSLTTHCPRGCCARPGPCMLGEDLFDDEKPLSKFKIVYNKSGKSYKHFDERLSEFRFCEDEIDKNEDPSDLFFETMEEVNEDVGIRVDPQGNIVC
jgi:hypothetical protein